MRKKNEWVDALKQQVNWSVDEEREWRTFVFFGFSVCVKIDCLNVLNFYDIWSSSSTPTSLGGGIVKESPNQPKTRESVSIEHGPEQKRRKRRSKKIKKRIRH